MTLVEVIVATALFGVLASALLGVIVSMSRSSGEAGTRTVATNLAVRELEITRDVFVGATRGPDRVEANQTTNPNPLPGGTAGAPLVVDGIPFTVVRSTQWASVSSTGGSTCDDGTEQELAYLKVKVAVSWPGLGSRPPVTMDTIMTPPKGTYSNLTGHIGLKVIDRFGAPQGGIRVVVTAANGATHPTTTSSDGCALVAFLTPGAYTVRVDKPGYVNEQGDPTGTLSAPVQAGQLWKGTISYDRAASLRVTASTAPGYTVPNLGSIAVTVGNPGITPAGSRAIAGSGSSRTVTNLWPYPSGYQVWWGGCNDNDPQFSGQVRDLPVTTDPGTLATTDIVLAPVDLEDRRNKVYVATQHVTAQTADNGCPGGASITLGTTDSDGKLRTSLPYGTWTIKRQDGGGTVGTVNVVKDLTGSIFQVLFP